MITGHLRVDCRIKIFYLVFLIQGKLMVRVFEQNLDFLSEKLNFFSKNFKIR